MELIRVDRNGAVRVAPLVADFRVTLKAFKGIQSQPDIASGQEEIIEFLDSGFPVYAAEEDGILAGYIVCRVDGYCLWVEQIFVREEYRRKGVATLLFQKAEEIAASMGEETVYNYVHPNNETMIRFLRSKGYTVLNLIEIRKPYKDEKTTTTIQVDHNSFDY